MKTLKAQKRAAARKCEELQVSIGDRISIKGGLLVTVTAIGMSSILVKPAKGEECQIKEPSQIFGKYQLETLSFTFVPSSISKAE